MKHFYLIRFLVGLYYVIRFDISERVRLMTFTSSLIKILYCEASLIKKIIHRGYHQIDILKGIHVRA